MAVLAIKPWMQPAEAFLKATIMMIHEVLEEALNKKFGEEQYEEAKKAFQEALEQWRGKEDELDRKAFHMYEDFRPSVPKGQKGWGKKGQLNLGSVKSAVAGG